MRYREISALMLALLLGTGSALADDTAPPATPAGGTTVYPPANVGAGQGLLYFPQGGANSLYAVPVEEDPNLAAAMNGNTAAVTAGLSNMTTALNKLAGAGGLGGNGGSAGHYQISCLSGNAASPPVPAGNYGNTYFGGSVGTPATPGTCYMVDTTTGNTWHYVSGACAEPAFPGATYTSNNTPITCSASSWQPDAGGVASAASSQFCNSSTQGSFLPGQATATQQSLPVDYSVQTANNPNFIQNYNFPANVSAMCSYTCSNGGAWSRPYFANAGVVSRYEGFDGGAYGTGALYYGTYGQSIAASSCAATP